MFRLGPHLATDSHYDCARALAEFPIWFVVTVSTWGPKQTCSFSADSSSAATLFVYPS